MATACPGERFPIDERAADFLEKVSDEANRGTRFASVSKRGL